MNMTLQIASIQADTQTVESQSAFEVAQFKNFDEFAAFFNSLKSVEPIPAELIALVEASHVGASLRA